MKRLFSSLHSFFYLWNFKRSPFSIKRRKAINAKKKSPEKKKNRTHKKTDMLVFKDDKGVVCFSIQMEALYYIESDTNYITLFYSNQGKLEKYLMRSSLKMVLEENVNDNLVRCHRSYIVNFDKVKLYKKDKEGGVIELSNDLLPTIPVSKSYTENVLLKFQSQ